MIIADKQILFLQYFKIRTCQSNSKGIKGCCERITFDKRRFDREHSRADEQFLAINEMAYIIRRKVLTSSCTELSYSTMGSSNSSIWTKK